MISHNGYTFTCDLYCGNDETLTVKAKTRRTAVAKARTRQWFVGAIRIVFGGKSKTQRRVLCPCCRWVVGL